MLNSCLQVLFPERPPLRGHEERSHWDDQSFRTESPARSHHNQRDGAIGGQDIDSEYRWKSDISLRIPLERAFASLQGPKELFDKLEKEDRLTPMQTVLDCVDMLLDPKCRLTGQIVENFKDQNILRALPKYLNESVKKNMDEFHPVEQSDDALQTYGYPVF